MDKPYAASCEQNQQVILNELKKIFTEQGEVLEIGSGTGQHAVFFSAHLPQLIWQTSDLVSQHVAINQWLNEVEHHRIKPPLELDVDMLSWPIGEKDYIFSANITHIISTEQSKKMLQHVAQHLKSGGLFAQYGPFNYHGKYTSDSNANFDQWLKQRNPLSCIKHFEDIKKLANENALVLFKDIEMPANNRLLVWKKN